MDCCTNRSRFSLAYSTWRTQSTLLASSKAAVLMGQPRAPALLGPTGNGHSSFCPSQDQEL